MYSCMARREAFGTLFYAHVTNTVLGHTSLHRSDAFHPVHGGVFSTVLDNIPVRPWDISPRAII